jgi:protein-disulfide isomerase
MGKDRILNSAVVLMGVAALVTTALVVRRELAPLPPAPQYDRPQRVHEWRQYLRDGSRIGPVDATVTIVEFSDFQCKFCKQQAERLDRLRQAHPGEIAIVFRHYPIVERHPHAYEAALAAECARDQDRFEAYRNILYRKQDEIGETRWSDFARDAMVPDAERFGRCVSERRYARRIAADLKAGKKLGVPATPTILINQWKVVGLADEQELARVVEEARRDARRAVQVGGGGTP